MASTVSTDGGNSVAGILTLPAWAEKGIVGRGVLLDFHAWRTANNVVYNPFETGSIALEQLKAVAAAQGTEIRFGDILIIRSGRRRYKVEENEAESWKAMSTLSINYPREEPKNWPRWYRRLSLAWSKASKSWNGSGIISQLSLVISQASNAGVSIDTRRSVGKYIDSVSSIAEKLEAARSASQWLGMSNRGAFRAGEAG